uniref:Uncharacterized protein n=1 Tax=Lotus japonicus TaxID=34305 RepID=I3SL36_LOTJA|nr:unknown [Lotus japonicus]
MAISLNPIMSFSSKRLETKYQDATQYSVGASFSKATQMTPLSVMSRSRMLVKEKRFGHCFSVADSDQLAAATGSKDSGDDAENSPSVNPADETFQLEAETNVESGSPTSDDSNGSIDQKEGSETSSATKRTARDRLRAARVLSRYKDSSKETKPEMGKSVLDAFKESEKGKKRSRLPEAPSNLLDDSKRGMPKQGLTFDLPGGSDLFFIVFSFVFISTVMFATTYLVWKVGAIHFNEYWDELSCYS